MKGRTIAARPALSFHTEKMPNHHVTTRLRSQHLVILLADWMSAVALQAVFYGKSQTSIHEKVMMLTSEAKKTS